MFAIARTRFLWETKLEKLPVKLGNSGKIESAFFYAIFVMAIRNSFFCFVPYGVGKVFRKKKSGQLQGKVGK
jgi:hypothetical protein